MIENLETVLPLINTNYLNKTTNTKLSKFGNTLQSVKNSQTLVALGLARISAGAREPWRQSRRGSHKISPNGAKIGLGSHKFSEVID